MVYMELVSPPMAAARSLTLKDASSLNKFEL